LVEGLVDLFEVGVLRNGAAISQRFATKQF
jgi:hypothetical protein